MTTAVERPFPTERCKSPKCRRPIVWATTGTANTSMPVDPDPSDGGTVHLYWVADVVRARVLKAPERETTTQTLHTAHFATCPAANEFRTPRKANR